MKCYPKIIFWWIFFSDFIAITKIAYSNKIKQKKYDFKREFPMIRAMNSPSPFNPSPGKSQLQCLMVRLNRSSRMFLSVRKKYALFAWKNLWLNGSSIAGFDPTLWHRRLALGELILWQWGIASWFFTKIFQFEAPASIKTFLTSSGASYDGAPANKIFDFHHVHILELLTNQMDLKLTRKWTGSEPENDSKCSIHTTKF